MLLAIACLVVVSCRFARTEVVIVVSTDLSTGPRGLLNAVQVGVTGPDGVAQSRCLPISSARASLEPTLREILYVSVSPLNGDASRQVGVSLQGATASDCSDLASRATPVIEHRLAFLFVQGQTRVVHVDLTDRCRAVPCPPGFRCAGAEATCVTSFIDVAAEEPSRDAGAGDDRAPPRDAKQPPLDIAPAACASCDAPGCCDGRCVDLATSAINCGRCGVVCDAGQTCRGGTCVAEPCANSTLARCGAGCVDLSVNQYHCGACGNACGADLICRDRQCVSPCTSGQMPCADGCRFLDTDASNCGGCGRACGGGQMCQSGQCVDACTNGRIRCGASCVYFESDPSNCGACGRSCVFGEVCSARVCVCPAGRAYCGSTCRDVQTDNSNCGACGVACPSAASCIGGACQCPTGQTLCRNFVNSSGCFDTTSDPANCGACGRACAAGQSCRAGVCTAASVTNDLPVNATSLSLATPVVTLTGSTVGATRQGTCGTEGDVFYGFSLARREIVWVNTFGSTFDTTIALLDAGGTVLTGQCNDNSACGGAQSSTGAVLTPGAYLIAVGGARGAGGTFTLNLHHLPAGNGPATQVIDTSPGIRTFSGQTSGTGLITQGCGGSQAPENSYWFTTCPGGTAIVLGASTCGGAGFDTILSVQTTSRAVVASDCSDDACPSLASRVTAAIPAGAALHEVFVDGYATLSGRYALALSFGGCQTTEQLCADRCLAASSQCPCTASLAPCGTSCVDLSANQYNCGQCGRACGLGTCNGGACACSNAAFVACGTTACVDLQSDLNHCGTCPNPCTYGQRCQAGTCRPVQSSCPVSGLPGCGLVSLAGGTRALGPSTLNPRPMVSVSPFVIDQFEVSVARFRAFRNSGSWTIGASATYPAGQTQTVAAPVEPTARTTDNGCNWTSTAQTGSASREDQPINCVDWRTALAFCRWDGGRLPTEAEWEFVARAADDRVYPWGNTPAPSLQVCWAGRTPPSVGTCGLFDTSFTGGQSAAGVWHLAGNVAEWTADRYTALTDVTCWGAATRTNPLCLLATDMTTVRGGDWSASDPAAIATTARTSLVETDRTSGRVGFRCARTR
ncbi:MAG: SUMF1/EgtB/PvdO family nonheme iron enzyme [Polyangiales bacterium]